MAPKKAAKSAAKEVDRQLERYRAMRDFAMTAEPSGEDGSKHAEKHEHALPFVIQKHAATRLHYDFRLGWRGVLKSWAVAKGPSYYPGDKRLAVEVEDHPISYGGFEGTIPKGQYGGGTVMVWDQGTWEPLVDVDEGLRAGRLKFTLHGKKLKGNWALVRMGGKFAREGKPNWLLIKEHDKYERSADEEPITEEAPDSATTGRDMEAIAKAEDHVWQSHKAARSTPNRSRLALRSKYAENREEPAKRGARVASTPEWTAVLKGTPREQMPKFVAPQLASEVKAPPAGEGWLHELKLDGYRIQAHVVEQKRRGREATLFSRNGLDWTHRMPEIARAAIALPVKDAVLDGEVVVLDDKGHTSFADLQATFEKGRQERMTYFVFDLLHLDGYNLRGLSLVRRKEILKGLLNEALGEDAIRYSDHIRAEGAKMFANACRLSAEGVVSKLVDGKYVPGRSRQWVKSKCVHQQEFVVGGFTLPSGSGMGIGALLLGYYRDGELIYAGRTGTGFTQASRRHLRRELNKLRTAESAFSDIPREAAKDATWAEPKLVAEVSFASWTAGGMVRQAAFQGIREEKPAKDVMREEAGSIAKPERVSGGRKAMAHTRRDASAKSGDGDADVDGVRLTHPKKVLDKETQLTKLQLARYYSAVADVMLPYIDGRPLSLVRCPEGSERPCFFQKHAGSGLPEGVSSVPVKSKSSGATEQYITIDNATGLVGLAQLGVLEIHPWSTRNDALETPDRLIFDLDPGDGVTWEQLVASAMEVRDLLKQLKLQSFVKSTGGKGLHVVAPVRAERGWAEIKEFAHNFVRMMEVANPKLYLTKMTKAARKSRIYLDYLRNERGATAVAPYSPRARKGVHVAIPLSWDELKKMGRPEFSVANFDSWKAWLKHDPWKKMETLQQSLTAQAIRAVKEFAA
jgi:bifunctional non-homologous end joining protein LigD